MVAKESMIAWSKATLYAIVIPAALYAFLPYGWIASLAWLALVTWLYATVFKYRPAAYPFAVLLFLVAMFVIPAFVANEAMDNVYEATDSVRQALSNDKGAR